MIKLLIYEDNEQLRESLTILINGTDGFKVLGAFENCNDVVEQVKMYNPDLVLMDIDMPETNGIEGLQKIRNSHYDVKVLILTVFDDDKNIFEALKNGANGYILKKTPPARLLENIQEAYHGGGPMTSSIATEVLKMFSQLPIDRKEDFNLSSREKEVLQLLVYGFSYKMIASSLFISIDTVRSHIKKIYEKLHVNSKSEAVAKAFRKNIL